MFVNYFKHQLRKASLLSIDILIGNLFTMYLFESALSKRTFWAMSPVSSNQHFLNPVFLNKKVQPVLVIIC